MGTTFTATGSVTSSVGTKLTRTEMNSEVADIVKRTDKTTAINTRLQWAMDEIAGMYSWRSLRGEDTSIVLVESDKTYSIPATMRFISGVRNVDETDEESRYLTYKEPDEFHDNYPYPESGTEGRPRVWMREGDVITIYPIPSSSEVGEKLYLHGQLWPTAFSGDSSTSSLSRVLDKAIIYLAASMTFESIQEEDVAETWAKKAENIINREWGNESAHNEGE